VELQGNLVTLQKHGIQPYAISYDPVDTLYAFAEKHGLTYPLLSDANSAVIRAFNILNTLVPEGHRWYGVPFPGTYMVDAKGVVRDKSFYANHGVRDGVAHMLQESFHATPAGRPVQTFETDDLIASAALSSATIRRGQVQTITVEIELKNDRHIYAPKVTDGYTPTALTFDAIEDVTFADVQYPQPEPIKLLGKSVPVYTDKLTLKTTLLNRRREDFAVCAHLNYQACDDKECYMPQDLTFELPLIFLDNV